MLKTHSELLQHPTHTHDERESRALCPRKWYSWLIDTFIWINFRQIKIMLNDDRQQSCLVVPMVYFMAREGKREKRKKSWFRYLWTQKLNSLQTNINKAYQRGESNTYRSHSPLTYHLFGTHKFFVCFPPSLPWCESQHSSCSYQKFKEIACSFFRVWEKHVNIQAEKLSKILPNKTSSKKSPEKLYHAFFISFDSFFSFGFFFFSICRRWESECHGLSGGSGDFTRAVKNYLLHSNSDWNLGTGSIVRQRQPELVARAWLSQLEHFVSLSQQKSSSPEHGATVAVMSLVCCLLCVCMDFRQAEKLFA